MDVLWFHMPRDKSDKVQSFGKIDLGKMLIMIDRGDYWQCGYIIRKGDFDRIKAVGLNSFHQDLLSLMPSLMDRVKTLDSWDKIKLLTAKKK